MKRAMLAQCQGLLIAWVVATLNLIALLLPGDSSASKSFLVLHDLIGGEDHITVLFFLVVVTQTVAIMAVRRKPRIASAALAGVFWVFLSYTFLRSNPNSLGWGAQLGAAVGDFAAVYLIRSHRAP